MSRQPARQPESRTADEVAALWEQMAAGQPLFLVIRSGRRDIPVSVSMKDGGHCIVVVGHNENEPFADFSLLARLLVEGRRITKAGYMQWSGDMAREGAIWQATKRMESSASRYGYSSAEAEFAAKFKGKLWGGRK